MKPVKIAKKIRKAMAEHGETQGSVAAKTGVSVSQISRFTQGQFKTASKGLIEVCRVLSVEHVEVPKTDKELEFAVLKAWDGTKKHKNDIMQMLRLISEWG